MRPHAFGLDLPNLCRAVLTVCYEYGSLERLLTQPDVLAIIGCDQSSSSPVNHPAYLSSELAPLGSDTPFEVWRSTGSVSHDVDQLIRYSYDSQFLFGRIELDERDYGDIAETSALAYRELEMFTKKKPYPHLLRIWNYFGAINKGEGDHERYKQFCVGRVRGAGDLFANGYPAATVIGSRPKQEKFQIYWLASRLSGHALENPRQTSAYHYPRQYSPVAPAFSRAMLVPSTPAQLHISGTAAIVGHRSQHPENAIAQLEEIFQNFEVLLNSASHYGLPPQFTAQSLLKGYVRNREDFPIVHSFLENRLPPGCQFLLFQGDICRQELSVEIDAVHTAHSKQ